MSSLALGGLAAAYLLLTDSSRLPCIVHPLQNMPLTPPPHLLYAVCLIQPDHPLSPREVAMDLSARNPALRMNLWHFAASWCQQQLGQVWADVYEGPTEFPIEYAPGQFGYRTCVRTPLYPNGMWVDVLLTVDDHIIGALHVLSTSAPTNR